MASKVKSIFFLYNRKNLRKCRKILFKEHRKWIYLGDNFLDYFNLSQKLKGLGAEIKAQPLNNIAQGIRKEYIDYIGELSTRYNSLTWWESVISEKQPSNSTLFRNLCLWEKTKSLLNKEKNALLIIGNLGLYNQIADFFKDKESIPFEFLSKCGFYLKSILLLLAKRTFFVLSQIKKIIITKLKLRSYTKQLKRKLQQKPLILINSWIDNRSFSEKRGYYDSYFKKLPDIAAQEGYNVVIIPYILPTIKYGKALDYIKKVPDKNFLVPHYFLSFLDILKFSLANFSQIIKYKNLPLFREANINKLLRFDRWNDLINNRICFNRLFYVLPIKLKKCGFNVQRVIYPFENQTWEKVYLAGLKKAFPQAITVGYQHTSFSSLTTNYYISDKELRLIPLPDKIVTAGERPEEILKGHFSDRVKTGGAIRYEYLFKQQKRELSKEKKSTKRILVALPGEFEEALELLYKISSALKSFEAKIILKSHPTLPLGKIQRYLGLKAFPKNFHIPQSNTPSLLKTADLMIATSTTMALEALALKIPVLKVDLDFSIVAGPLIDMPEAVFSAHTEKDICELTKYILLNKNEIIKEKRNIWEEAISSSFTPPDISSYKILLNE